MLHRSEPVTVPDGRGPPKGVAVLGSDDGAGDSGVPGTPVLQEQVGYTLNRSSRDFLTFLNTEAFAIFPSKPVSSAAFMRLFVGLL
jgi:hypothetical protein